MDLSLNKKQIDLLNQTRELLNSKIKPHSLELDSNESKSFDWSLVYSLSELNLVCPKIPKEYGGLGLDHFTTALVIEEIASVCSGLAAVVNANIHAVEPIILAGTKEQKERYLPSLTGNKSGLASFALTEIDGGSDVTQIKSYAKKKDSVFILNGTKDYIINAAVSEFISVVASTSLEQKKSSMRLFIVPKNTPGIIIEEKKKTSGMKYAHISRISFKEAKISEDHVIKGNEAGSGYLLLTQTFDLGRSLVGATSVGIARAAYEAALEYSKKRHQFGKPIKDHQTIGFALADMATKIEMARLITWKACWLIDKGGDYSIASAMAKVAASSIAQDVTNKAADIFGAKGYESGTLIEKLVRDARVLSTIEGTNHVQNMVIASQL